MHFITKIFLDNALFIRYWRERTRLHIVGSYISIVFLVIGLIFLKNYLDYAKELNEFKAQTEKIQKVINLNKSLDTYSFNKDLSRKIKKYNYELLLRTHKIGKNYKPFPLPLQWLKKVIFQITVVQGILLFLFGTYFSIKMTGFEKSSGTLDFHRCSPTARIPQTIGLIFGPPILEWCLFLGILVVNIIVIAFADVNVKAFISFYVSIIISAIFLHSLSVLYSICSKSSQYRIGGIFLAICLSLFLISKFSCVYHATPFPAYTDLSSNLNNSMKSVDYNDSIYLFLGYHFPYLLLQSIVQIPLIILFWLGIKRKLEYGELPVWSKVQSAVFSALVLFYFTGSIIGVEIYSGFDEVVVVFFWFTVFILMLITVPLATPTHLAFTKGLRRARRIGLKNLSLNDDHSSNWLWTITLCFIISANFGMIASYYVHLFNESGILWAISLIAGLCYFVFFSSILEWFYLSKYHEKKSLLIAGLIILWVVVPVFYMIINLSSSISAKLQYFAIPSQFFGMITLTTGIFEDIFHNKMSFETLIFILIILILYAIIAVLFALFQRLKFKKEIFNPKNCHT